MRLIDLSDRCLFHLHGPDAESYLNGQVTQDVRNFASSDPTRWACICTAKGKMQGIMLIHRREGKDGFFIDAPSELRETLALRLDRYLIADDAELIDISGQSLLIHSDQEFTQGMTSANRFGFDGFDLWLTPPELATLKEEHADRNWAQESDLETERIIAGVPKWGKELTEDTLPPEAKLEERAISYFKGCYVGQETISRIKSVGRVNRKLTRFTSTQSIDPGTLLSLPDSPEKSVGEITSAAKADSTFVALGYLKRQAADIRTLHTQAGEEVTVVE